MNYYTVFDYKVKNDTIVYPSSTACFGSLYSHFRDNPSARVGLFRCYLIRELTGGYSHKFIHTVEQIERVFKSFDNFLGMPKITEITSMEIPNVRRYSAIINQAERPTVVIEFDFSEKSIGYAKFASTLCRYFYENLETSANYLAFMERYIECLDIPEYDSIPRIELLQLVHSYKMCAAGHGFFDTMPNSIVNPIKEDLFVNRIKDEKFTCLNGNTNALFYGVTKTPSAEKKLDYHNVIKNYLNENINIGSKSLC